jgi:hypothetical protein
MNNQPKIVSSKTLSDKVIMQLMTFNKCTHARAVFMYKEMLQTIADYYLLEKVSSKTQGREADLSKTQIEIQVFAMDVCNAYGLIEDHTKQLTKQLC